MRENKRLDQQDKDEIDLSQLLARLFDHRYVIATVTLCFALVGVTYTFLATPVYRANALIQIEQDVGSTLMQDVSRFLPGVARPVASTEIALLRSRMVLGETLAKRNLLIEARPLGLPLFGNTLQSVLRKTTPTVTIARFEVPDTRLNTALLLTVVDATHYRLQDGKGGTLEGQVGQVVHGLGVTLKVEAINALAGERFTLTRYSLQQAVDRLRQALTVTESGKDGGMLALSLTGSDPADIEQTLNTLIADYLAQNLARKSEESSRSLAFLKTTLPDVRQQLDVAEEKLNAFRETHQSVDLSLEAKSALDTLVSVESQLNDVTFKEAEISKRYTRDHPAYRALLEKRQTLRSERDVINQRVSQMPGTQQEILRLTRDVESGQTLYMTLLSKQQELNIIHASTLGNVRIIDTALVEPIPIAPRNSLIVLLSICLGGLFSCGGIVLYHLLRRGIETPEQVESLGLSVFAAIPHSIRQVNSGENALSPSVLALIDPTDLSIEALRGLRTSLHFARLDAINNVIAITGTAPGSGKSFICANLAVVMAQAGLNVLLIDGDMRRGYLHKTFHVMTTKGLSGILSGASSPQSALQRVEGVEGLTLIARGDIPPNPSELLMRPAFEDLLVWANKSYDVVLLDTPPILAVTDGIVACRHAGSVFLTARFEQTSLREISLSAQRLAQSHIVLNGVLINNVVRKASTSGCYSYYSYGADNQ